MVLDGNAVATGQLAVTASGFAGGLAVGHDPIMTGVLTAGPTHPDLLRSTVANSGLV